MRRDRERKREMSAERKKFMYKRFGKTKKCEVEVRKEREILVR